VVYEALKCPTRSSHAPSQRLRLGLGPFYLGRNKTAHVIAVMTAARKTASRASPDAEKQLKGFIDKFEPKHQALIRAVRKAMRKRLPTANELAYDNYNFFVIGYCPNDRPSDSIISIAAGSNGVGLCFIHGASLPDPHKILLGSGNQTRFIRVESAKTLARPEVEGLIAAAIAKSKVPFSATGARRLVIRSVSAKQRPRRKSG
jgi:hypothetical protein